MKMRLLAAALLVALAAGWLGWQLAWSMAEDACLDHAGQWEAAGSYCANVTSP